MKVKIITIHDPNVNYGSTLQSCGTYNFIRALGYDVEIINYRPNYKTFKHKIKSKIVSIIFYKAEKDRRYKIDNYFNIHAKLTKPYYSYKELEQNPPVSNVYITGSDVIWNKDVNSEGKDRAYYLGFVKKGYKISYAPSMGEIQSDENLLYIKNLINTFDYISVREEISKNQLLGVGLQNVKCVNDPVFLLEKNYYEKQIKENQYGDYTLVYLMSDTEKKRILVREISKKYDDKVISFGGFKKKCECDLFIRDAGVEDFLTLIYHANHIITDSFHCIAFSLMFEKQFVYLPSIDSSMRIENILHLTDLTNRIICELDEICVIDNEIDYTIPSYNLSVKNNESREYLREALFELETREKNEIS